MESPVCYTEVWILPTQKKILIITRYEIIEGFFKHAQIFFLINLFYLFILLTYFWLRWVFVAVRVFFSCGERGLLFFAVRGLLIAVASLVVEHGL